MTREPKAALQEVLAWVEEHIDLDHVAEVEERHRVAMSYQPVDRPPVAVGCDPSVGLPYYSYAEGFADPVKMMVNELVRPFCHAQADSPGVVSSLEIGDDFVLSIRANYGVGLIASLFGSEIVVKPNNMPWARPIGREGIVKALDRGVPDLRGGLGGRVMETMEFYRQELADYPRASRAVHITQPDMEGAVDNLHLLWGGELLVALYDEPELIHRCLDLMVQTYIALCQELRRYTTEQVGPEHICVHWGVLRGNLILKNDTGIMISPQQYAQFLRPYDEQIFAACGPGAIHFCGCADHSREEILPTQGLQTLDFGQPELNDFATWYEQARARQISIMRLPWPREQFLSGAYREQFPTGVSFAVPVADVAEGRELMAALNA